MSPLGDEMLEENTDDSKLDGDETNSVGTIGSLENLVDDGSDLEGEIKKRKKYKRGVIYLSFIPPSMNPTILRRLLSEYGEIERIFLQPELKRGKKEQKKIKNVNVKKRKYSEGWVEFLKKRDAKRIAAFLNNTQIGGKKKSKFHEYLWNMKYLPGFKWIHLCERLNYERAVRQQRLRAEVRQAKKIANHFAETVDKEEKLKRRRKHLKQSSPLPDDLSKHIFQKEAKKYPDVTRKTDERREDFLKSLFG